MIQPHHKNRNSRFVGVWSELDAWACAGQGFQVRFFTAGEMLLQQGNDGDFVMQIVEGEVEDCFRGERTATSTRSLWSWGNHRGACDFLAAGPDGSSGCVDTDFNPCHDKG